MQTLRWLMAVCCYRTTLQRPSSVTPTPTSLLTRMVRSHCSEHGTNLLTCSLLDLDVPPRRDSPAAESSGDSGDEYVQEKKRPVKPKRRSKRRGGEDEEGRPQKKRKRTSSKRAAPEEIDLSQYPPDVGA